jgi:ADP-ribose pyrophosphatase YjhB (NUDIX family)
MKYCSGCGEEVTQKVPDDDTRHRYVCLGCETIHYQNPNIVAGTIPVHEGKVLLCKRAIEPRYGFWTLPAGFMENQETTMEAAARETWEEAEAKVKLHSLYTVINVPQIDQVHMYFLATLIDGKFGVGSESLECQLFEEDEIPWDDLAFPTVKRTLKLYFEDRQHGEFSTHVSDIYREPREPEFEVIRED